MAELKVKKRLGKVEDFDAKKIKMSLLKTGAKAVEAHQVAYGVEGWCRENAVAGMVDSYDIGKEVSKRILKLNKEAGKLFTAVFEKTRKKIIMKMKKFRDEDYTKKAVCPVCREVHFASKDTKQHDFVYCSECCGLFEVPKVKDSEIKLKKTETTIYSC